MALRRLPINNVRKDSVTTDIMDGNARERRRVAATDRSDIFPYGITVRAIKRI
jgi:hypothetical protein